MVNQLRPDQSRKLARLEKKRLALGVSVDLLAARSGLGLRKVFRIRREGRGRPSELLALTYALRGLERERPATGAAFGSGSPLDVAARLVFAGLVASLQDRVPADLVRKVALYLLVAGANVPGATAGRAYGCSKQYVSKAVRQVEDLREDPAIGGVIDRLEETLLQEVLA